MCCGVAAFRPGPLAITFCAFGGETPFFTRGFCDDSTALDNGIPQE